MKILISLSYYSPHISGLTLAMRHLAELLQNNGFNVTVFAAQHDKGLPTEEKMNEVSIVRVPYLFRVSKGFIMPGFSLKAINLLTKNDAVLITMPQAQSLLVAIFAKLLRKKIVGFYICEVTFPGGLRGKIIDNLIRLVNKLTLLFADHIVTLTDDFARNNDILKKTGKKVIGIYPVVPQPQIIKTEKNILHKKLPQKQYYIGYLGRIASEKGIDYLLETIPILRKELGDSFVIVLAGPKKTVGEELYQKKIKQLLSLYSSFVVQLGELSDSQLGAFYSLLDVFVLPSTNNTEAFGMVQVEAMYCGTPVVSTDLPGVRVPIQETGMGELVPSSNISSLAQAIVKVLQNKRSYVKAPSVIKEVFSKEKIIEAYQNIFAS